MPQLAAWQEVAIKKETKVHKRKSIILVVSSMLLTLAGLASAAPGAPRARCPVAGGVPGSSRNPNGVQLPVSEAAPGNPNYNGGRWSVQLVTWTEAGFIAHGGYAPILKSAEDVSYNEQAGYLEIKSGDNYFQCPLLPVK